MGIGQYFGMKPGDRMSQHFAQLLPLERMQAALDGGEIVGGAGSFPFTLADLTSQGYSISFESAGVVGIFADLCAPSGRFLSTAGGATPAEALAGVWPVVDGQDPAPNPRSTGSDCKQGRAGSCRWGLAEHARRACGRFSNRARRLSDSQPSTTLFRERTAQGRRVS